MQLRHSDLASCTSKTLTAKTALHPAPAEILHSLQERRTGSQHGASLFHLWNSDILMGSTGSLSKGISHFPLNHVVSPQQQIPAMGQLMLPHRFNLFLQTAQAVWGNLVTKQASFHKGQVAKKQEQPEEDMALQDGEKHRLTPAVGKGEARKA